MNATDPDRPAADRSAPAGGTLPAARPVPAVRPAPAGRPTEKSQPAPGVAGLAPGRAAAFIEARTQRAAVPLVPEIELFVSRAEPTVLWEQTEQELGCPDLAPPFWAYPWAGGIALARYVLDHPEQVAGRIVLDMAAGSGLVAIAAALAGAAQVTACDIDPMAAAAIGLNGRANNVTVTITSTDLLAGDLLAAGPVPAGGPTIADLVLVGDAWYERRLAHRMTGFLTRSRAAGARWLTGDPGRTYLPTAGLRAVASYAVPVWAGLEDTDVKQTTVWEPAPAAC
ncbi:MAG TPA: 50S ribosomal protein L11 methyltransferase [Streptosporangiaceae bacterium]|jgi:predicted nicotinamide N-methyase